MVELCRLPPEELVAYRDGTLPPGKRELVEAHLTACRHCQERIALFDDVDHIIQTRAVEPVIQDRRRAELGDRLRQTTHCRRNMRHQLRRMGLGTPSAGIARALVALLVVLTTLPVVAEAGFPLRHVVHFAEIEIRQMFSTSRPVTHVTPSMPGELSPVRWAVAPEALPLEFERIEYSRPDAERIELLYRNAEGITILVTELPAEAGVTTVEASETDLAVIRGVEVLALRDPRPETVSAFFWEREGVFFDVMVITAPPGKDGGLKRADALEIAEHLMAAQDRQER